MVRFSSTHFELPFCISKTAFPFESESQRLNIRDISRLLNNENAFRWHRVYEFTYLTKKNQQRSKNLANKIDKISFCDFRLQYDDKFKIIQ